MVSQKKIRNKTMRKKQRDNGYFELSDIYHTNKKRVALDRKKIFENINKLKEKIVLNSNSGNQKKADTFLRFLLENQKEKGYLVKSLSDISTKIDNINFKIKILKLAYEIDNYDTVTLSSYATALANNGDNEKSFEFFEKSLRIDENNIVTLFSFGLFLKSIQNYPKAIEMFKRALDLDILDYQKNYLYLMLGELYFYNGQKILGEKYFQLLIDNSKNKDEALIKSALAIFKQNPYDERGSKKLLEVSYISKFIKQAFGLLSVSATQKLFYKFFNHNKNENSNIINTTLELNRAIYHKIENQISILRALFDMSIRKESNHTIKEKLKEIQFKVLEIFQIIKDKKDIEKKTIDLNKNDFDKLIEVISNIAHNITDKISNKLHVIKSRLMILKKNYPEIDNQIKTTVATLNNLKDLKQGSLRINIVTFQLQELLKNLKHNMQLNNAVINFEIINGEINSDKQKITECINELIEKKEGDFLKIIYTDNGRGIKSKNKEWIFNPLNSTIKDGSGLGLFIIKRIVEKLHGRIYEDGINGARFNIYIPNRDKEK